MTEKFCLKWNDFHSNVSKSFGLFRHEDYLHDVTLVSDDNKQVSAHKLVLSSCSEYFKSIFKHNSKPNVHPLLCLDGITAEDLKNIMDYIYNGEVQIFQEDLDRFLIVAQRLKLEGLMGGKVKDEVDNQDQGTVKDEYDQSLENEATPSFEETTNTERKMTKKKRETFTGVVALNQEVYNVGFNKQVLQYLEECSDGSFKCTACGKTSDKEKGIKSIQRSNMMKHIETHVDGISYSCPFCQKTFR